MMRQRSGVGLVEMAILEALDARRARPGGRPVRCEKVLAELEGELGLARGYAYPVLIDLIQPWKLPAPLVEGRGNFGGRGDDPPASPRYTEARVSPVGQVALAAERGEIAPVPIGMINGNTHREGIRPPFRPGAVIDAIRQVLLRPRLSGSLITGIVGPPDFITGCTVTGDLAALAAGQYAELGLHARVTVTDAAYVTDRRTRAAVPGHTRPGWDPSRPVVVIDKFPPYANPDEVALSISKRAEEYSWHARHPELAVLTGLPIEDVADLSTSRGGYWLACLPSDGTPPEVLRDQIQKVHGVSIYVTTRLPRALPAMIRTWTRAFPHEDLTGSLTALENALASRLQRRLMPRY
ncbi:MAG TPA: DNA gyrase subunit A [Streptosporangiaceae bacterium]